MITDDHKPSRKRKRPVSSREAEEGEDSEAEDSEGSPPTPKKRQPPTSTAAASAPTSSGATKSRKRGPLVEEEAPQQQNLPPTAFGAVYTGQTSFPGNTSGPYADAHLLAKFAQGQTPTLPPMSSFPQGPEHAYPLKSPAPLLLQLRSNARSSVSPHSWEREGETRRGGNLLNLFLVSK